ncbi:hypothetical protein AB0D38_35230 [Streptomyces sp. NPDC048279]|uniref:hypothetical protein n=1 Tax=Streptomyces sp. NPDC048279 TaxID=3154714 RepID=UPI00341AB384
MKPSQAQIRAARKAGSRAPDFGSGEKVVRGWRKHQLTVDQMVRYGINSVFDPAAVPKTWRTSVSLQEIAPLYLTYLFQQARNASPETQLWVKRIQASLERPVRVTKVHPNYAPITPGSAAKKNSRNPAAASSAGSRVVQSSVSGVSATAASSDPGCSSQSYFDTGTLFVSHPYYCLYATEHFALLYNHNQGLPESSGANGVPTAIVEMANAAEEAYAVYTSGEQVGSVTIPGLGYREPDGRVTIFVGDVAHDHAGDAAGFTLPVGPGEQPSIWMPQDPRHYDALVRHELFHAFQYQYLSTSGFIWDAATQWFQGDFASLNWWMESTAQWATGRSYALDPYWPLAWDPGWSSNGFWSSESQYQAAQRSYYLGALDDFLEAPGRALNAWDGLSASRQYGEFPLAEYLSERAGTPDAVRKTWETIGEHDVLPLDAVSTVSAGYGLDLHDELMGFAIANYRLSTPGTAWSQQANSGKGADVTVGGYTTAEAGTAWRDALNSAGSDAYGPARPAHETYDLAWSGSAASTGTQSASLQPGGTLYADLVPKDTGASDQLGLLTVQVPAEVSAALIKWPRTSFTGGIQYPTVTQLDRPDSGTISVPVDDARFIETLVLTRTDFKADSTAAMADTETVSWQAKLTSFNQLDLSTANRRGAVAGLYDWSKAGYREGAGLPGAADMNSDGACEITADELATQYGVVPDDGVDDTAGLQNAIDYIKANCSPSASYTKLSRITLPVGVINVSHQIYVDADYLVIRGSGADPATGTAIHFAPDANTRYDTI